MIGCLPTQALSFLAVFVYATHATQAIAFEWKPGLSGLTLLPRWVTVSNLCWWLSASRILNVESNSSLTTGTVRWWTVANTGSSCTVLTHTRIHNTHSMTNNCNNSLSWVSRVYSTHNRSFRRRVGHWLTQMCPPPENKWGTIAQNLVKFNRPSSILTFRRHNGG